MTDGRPQSPCTNTCRIDPRSAFCQGCFRTLGEIERWGEMTHEEKSELLRLIDVRRETQGEFRDD
jgi:uncharacterized protein